MISGVTVVSRAVDLGYPLGACVEALAEVCSEIVVNVDIGVPDDGTMDLARATQKRLGVPLRIVPSIWDHSNRNAGTEVGIQTNKAFAHAGEEWILYAQCDEILHEEESDLIRWLTTLPEEYAGAELTRLYFWQNGQTVRTDWTMPLVRLIRRGRGEAVEDGMSCQVQGKIWPVEEGSHPALYHYSRTGPPEMIAKRISNNDEFHHDPATVRWPSTYSFELKRFDSFSTEVRDIPTVSADVLIPFSGTHPKAAAGLY